MVVNQQCYLEMAFWCWQQILGFTETGRAALERKNLVVEPNSRRVSATSGTVCYNNVNDTAIIANMMPEFW